MYKAGLYHHDKQKQNAYHDISTGNSLRTEEFEKLTMPFIILKQTQN